MSRPQSFFPRPTDWTPQATGVPLGKVPSLTEMLTEGSRAGGAGPAVTDQDGTLTYPELDRAASAVANLLLAAGVGPNEPVVIHCSLSRWAIVAMLGVIRTGAQYVPVDTAFPVERRAQIIAGSGAGVALVEPGDEDLPPGWPPEATVVPVPDRPEQWPATPGVPREVDPHDPVYTLFTSGSSGTPKGVVVSRDGLACSTQARRVHFDEDPTAYLLCTSISFDMSVGPIYHALATGAHLVIPSPLVVDTVAILDACRTHQATFISVIPSLYRILLDSGRHEELATLRAIIVAGEPCPPGLVRLHLALMPPHSVLHNEYGPTECTVWTTMHRCGPEDAEATDVAIGVPGPGTTAYIRTEDGPAETRVQGELWLGGPQVALGYTGSQCPGDAVPPPADRPVDRVYRTGDHVWLDEKGHIHYVGRIDGQLKLAGARVELQEIEQAVSAAADGRWCAVGVARTDGTARALVAFVVSAGEELNEVEMRRRLRSSLPHAAIPVAFLTVERLPTLANGKLDRHALDARAIEETTSAPVIR